MAPAPPSPARACPVSRGPWPALFYMGIPAGIVIDVVMDYSVFHHSRNLFPIEIAMWCVAAALPVAVGIRIGRWLEVREPVQADAPAQPAPIEPTGPSIWSPPAVVLWSFAFTPVLGACLQMLNWRALGEPDKAATSQVWLFFILNLFVQPLLQAAVDMHHR